ncbi:3535_t:CDS:2, partial [Cetraspora pellucida]
LKNLNKFEFNEENKIEINEENDKTESNDEDKTESNKENMPKIFEMKTIEMLEKNFATKKDILNIVQEIAQCSGFAVTIKSSGLRHSIFNINTAVPKDSKWQVIKVINRYNHPMAKDPRVFPEHHRLTRDAKCTAVQMLKAGAKPSMIYEAIRDENGEPTATRRDISNLGTQIYLSEENASMKALITNMKKRRYIVRREDQEDRHIKHLFFCHDNSIKDARHFPEVILVDATYKTNVYKLPFINFVNEFEKSYIWVLEKLFSLMFFDIVPSVFITDNDAALIGALKKIFSQSESLL